MKPASTAAFTVTRYLVTAAGQEPRQFREPAEALRVARLSVRRCGWANVYRVEGELTTDLWRRPVRLAAFEREHA